MEVCQKNSEQELRLRGSSNNCSIAEVDDHDPPDAILNRLTHCKRLPIFVSLATTDCHDEGDECSIEEDLKLDCIPCDRTLCITSPPHHLCYQDHDSRRISPISVVNATSALLSPIRPSFSSKTLHCYSH